jgi:hypothetical protein
MAVGSSEPEGKPSRENDGDTALWCAERGLIHASGA